MTTYVPTDIVLHQRSKILEVSFENCSRFRLPCEYLRVYSPSAEVRGHGPEDGVLQVGKEDVCITEVESVGHYAVRLVFDDGHSSGIYTWDYLHQLGRNQDVNWSNYLEALARAGHERDASKSGNS